MQWNTSAANSTLLIMTDLLAACVTEKTANIEVLASFTLILKKIAFCACVVERVWYKNPLLSCTELQAWWMKSKHL